jgi:acetyl esterase
MAWVAQHAGDYRVAPDRMLVAGQSAGAGLAMQVAYAVEDGTFASSCGGTVPQPKAVFALYPPDDFAMAWELNTGIGPAGARSLNTAYIGGSPEQYPQRYRAVSAADHVRPGLPPTLIAAGEHDHLVPFAGHREMVTNFNLVGVPNVLVTVPYSDHAYDVAWGSPGSANYAAGAVGFSRAVFACQCADRAVEASAETGPKAFGTAQSER